MANEKGIDLLNDAGQQRLTARRFQRDLLFKHQFAAEVAQRQRELSLMNAGGEKVPGDGIKNQSYRRTSAAAGILKLRLLHQMGFQHFTNDFGDAGGRQLRKAGKLDTGYRAKSVDQTIDHACVGLFDLVNMARLTVR